LKPCVTNVSFDISGTGATFVEFLLASGNAFSSSFAIVSSLSKTA